jgi:hypothetical protein
LFELVALVQFRNHRTQEPEAANLDHQVNATAGGGGAAQIKAALFDSGIAAFAAQPV